MSDLRQRPVQQPYPEPAEDDDVTDHSLSESDEDDEQEEDEEDEEAQARIAKEDDDGRFISPLDILRVLFALSLFVGAFSYFLTSDSFLMGYKPWFTNVPAVMSYFVRL